MMKRFNTLMILVVMGFFLSMASVWTEVAGPAGGSGGWVSASSQCVPEDHANDREKAPIFYRYVLALE